MLKISRMFGAIEQINSYWLLVIPRIMMTITSLVTDAASKSYITIQFLWLCILLTFISIRFVTVMRLTKVLDSPPYIAGCISGMSYITLVFHTRTFSNSLELCFLAILLASVVRYVGLCFAMKQDLNRIEADCPGNTDPGLGLYIYALRSIYTLYEVVLIAFVILSI